MLVEIVDNAVLVAGALVFLISGVVQALKLAFEIDKRFVPLISFVIGFVIGALLAVGFGVPFAETVLAGAVGGLGASGLYDNIKSV